MEDKCPNDPNKTHTWNLVVEWEYLNTIGEPRISELAAIKRATKVMCRKCTKVKEI